MTHPDPRHRVNTLFIRVAVCGLAVLLTVTVTWLLAHEGHAPLPSRGVDTKELDKGRLIVSRDARQALDVQTAEVVKRPVAESLLAYATLTTPWQQHAFVSSRLPGRVVKMLAQPGRLIMAGELLAEVESMELETLQLEILNADNDIRLTQQIVKDLSEATKSGATSAQTLIEAESKHRQNLNALQVARSKWAGLGLSADDLGKLLKERKPVLRTLPIRSAVSGTVVHADLTVGRVIESLEHLFEVVDLSTVWVRIGVLEKDLHRVSVGQKVELRLTAYPGEAFGTTVRVKGFHLDPKSHLNTVWAELTNRPDEPRFLPGMAGEVELTLPAPASTAVPAEAVLRSGSESFVLVEEAEVSGGSQYQRRNVVAGRQAGGWVEVKSGELYPGDRVVTRGGHQLTSFFIQGVLKPGPEAILSILQSDPSTPSGTKDLVEPLTAHVVEDVVEMDGAVDVPADRRGHAASPFDGNLSAIRVDRGQTVKAGDVLAEVISLDLQSYQLDLLKAHLEGQLLEDTLKRLKELEGLVPRRRVLEAESEVNANRQKRGSLERKLVVAGLSLSQLKSLRSDKQLVETLPIRSPVDGVVVSFDRALGQSVKAQEALFTIHDLSQPLVQAHVSERDLGKVHVGQSVRVRFRGGPLFVGEGKVVRSGRVFGEDSRTLAVWVSLKGQPAEPLRHGQLARLSMTVRRPAPTLSVPLEAVVTEGTRAHVFVRLADGSYERRAADLGRSDDRRVEVTRGVEAGERVAVRGAAELQTAYAAVE